MPSKNASHKVWKNTHKIYIITCFYTIYTILEMKSWIYWSESNSRINFNIFLNKNWKIYWSKQSFTDLGPEDRFWSWGLFSVYNLLYKQQEKIEDTKRAIRSCKFKNVTWQWLKENGQKKDLQNTTQKTTDRVTWTPLKTGGELWCFGRTVG